MRAHKWSMVAALATLAAVYLLAAEVAPRSLDLLHLLHQRKDRAVQVYSAEQWERELARIEQERSSLRESFEADLVRVPRNDQISLVLRSLHDAAETTGVTILQVRPGTSLSKETHEELPLQLQAHARFHDVGAFVDLVERSDFLATVEELQIAISNDETPLVRASLSLSITLVK